MRVSLSLNSFGQLEHKIHDTRSIHTTYQKTKVLETKKDPCLAHSLQSKRCTRPTANQCTSHDETRRISLICRVRAYCTDGWSAIKTRECRLVGRADCRGSACFRAYRCSSAVPATPFLLSSHKKEFQCLRYTLEDLACSCRIYLVFAAQYIVGTYCFFNARKDLVAASKDLLLFPLPPSLHHSFIHPFRTNSGEKQIPVFFWLALSVGKKIEGLAFWVGEVV